jgi:hypothetical protein
MLIQLLLTLTPAVAAMPQAPRVQAPASGSQAGAFAAQVGGTLWNSTSGGPQIALLGRLEGNVYALRISGTGTGWDEDFLIGIPPAPLSPAPLLVLFHQYSVSEFDTYSKTEFFKEALMRGWYVVAPLGAHELNFGIDYSQQNIEVCLNWVTDFFGGALDSERVYGVGFSMGGGALMSYASRHIDPEGVRFAALLNHTGSLSVADLYERCGNNDTTIFDHPEMFGGAPSTNELGYQRASSIHLWPQAARIDTSSDFVRNLQSTYIETWYSDIDPNPCPLVAQNWALNRYLETTPYLNQSWDSSEQVFTVNQHTWHLLDEGQILDTFTPLRAQDPTGTVDVLADRDARYFSVEIEQATQGVLSPFRFNSTPRGQNLIYFDRYSNISKVILHAAGAGLDTSLPLEVKLDGNARSSPIEFTITGYPNIPSDVTFTGTSSTDWAYDAALGRVTLQVTSPGQPGSYPTWGIIP